MIKEIHSRDITILIVRYCTTPAFFSTFYQSTTLVKNSHTSNIFPSLIIIIEYKERRNSKYRCLVLRIDYLFIFQDIKEEDKQTL